LAELIEVVHTTTYRYAEPVHFGEHRMMFRPQPHHDMRVLHAELEVTPERAEGLGAGLCAVRRGRHAPHAAGHDGVDPA